MKLVYTQLPLQQGSDLPDSSELDVDEEKQQLAVVYGVINHDSCDKCKKRGTLVLCEECPAAFHLECVPTDVPAPRTDCDDPWYALVSQPPPLW